MTMFSDSESGPIERGCGTRVKGGVYIETMLGPNGCPLECFMKDPPIAIDADAIGLSHIGSRIVERNGVTYVFDWVGESFYPNVTDFIEEVRRYGASRRMSANLDWSKLSPESKLVLVHSRAVYDMTDQMREVIQLYHSQICPLATKMFHDGLQNVNIFTHGATQQCARHWWYDHDQQEQLTAGETYTRTMPSFEYKAVTRVQTPTYAPGIFLVLPIHRVAVVRDEGTDSHVQTIEKVSDKLGGAFPVELVDS